MEKFNNDSLKNNSRINVITKENLSNEELEESIDEFPDMDSISSSRRFSNSLSFKDTRFDADSPVSINKLRLSEDERNNSKHQIILSQRPELKHSDSFGSTNSVVSNLSLGSTPRSSENCDSHKEKRLPASFPAVSNDSDQPVILNGCESRKAEMCGLNSSHIGLPEITKSGQKCNSTPRSLLHKIFTSNDGDDRREKKTVTSPDSRENAPYAAGAVTPSSKSAVIRCRSNDKVDNSSPEIISPIAKSPYSLNVRSAHPRNLNDHLSKDTSEDTKQSPGLMRHNSAPIGQLKIKTKFNRAMSVGASKSTVNLVYDRSSPSPISSPKISPNSKFLQMNQWPPLDEDKIIQDITSPHHHSPTNALRHRLKKEVQKLEAATAAHFDSVPPTRIAPRNATSAPVTPRYTRPLAKENPAMKKPRPLLRSGTQPIKVATAGMNSPITDYGERRRASEPVGAAAIAAAYAGIHSRISEPSYFMKVNQWPPIQDEDKEMISAKLHSPTALMHANIKRQHKKSLLSSTSNDTELKQQIQIALEHLNEKDKEIVEWEADHALLSIDTSHITEGEHEDETYSALIEDDNSVTPEEENSAL